VLSGPGRKFHHKFLEIHPQLLQALFGVFGGSNGEALSHGWGRSIPTCFYLWVTAYSLIVVSLFWSKMADQFSSNQSKRFFGFVGAGGSLGQFFGSFVASKGVHWLGPTYLLLVVVLMLELSVRCCLPLEATPRMSSSEDGPSRPVRPWSGLSSLLRSPYLLGICAYVFLYTFTSSFIYLQKQQMVQDSIRNRADKVSFFADINLIGSVCQVAIQLLLTGQIMTRLGLVFSLTLVPLITAGGFSILAAQPFLRVLALFEIVRKTLNFAVARPSREVLFTVLPRREKYLAKNAIDTFVYRAGDGLASVAFDLIKVSWVGLTGTALAVRYSLAAIPFAALWVLTAAGLALAQRRRAEAMASVD